MGKSTTYPCRYGIYECKYLRLAKGHPPADSMDEDMRLLRQYLDLKKEGVITAEIMEDYAIDPAVSHKVLAKVYGMHISTISKYLHGGFRSFRRWKVQQNGQ